MTDRTLNALLFVSIIALATWRAWVGTADAVDVSTPQYTVQTLAPVPTLINMTMPVLVAEGPCKYYTGTQYGTVPATSAVYLTAVDLDTDTATYRRIVRWPNKHYPSNPFDDTQETTEYTMTVRPWAMRFDFGTAVSGERYAWEAAP